MKMKTYFVAALFSLFIFTSFHASNDLTKDQVILETALEILKTGHYNPADINDSFSLNLYHLYLKDVDQGKRFFTQQDIEQFKPYVYNLDDEIKIANFDFFNLSEKIYLERFGQVKEYYNEILDKPMDFTVDEEINLDEEKSDYAKNLDGLKDIWRKSLKYQVMTKLADALDMQDKAKEKNDTSLKIKTYEVLEADARKSVLKTMNDYFRRLEQLNRNDRQALYINCVANCFDPHTEFFAPKDKEDFDITMSGKLEGIGATLQEKDGYVKVAGIVPGSPSWKQGELKEGDVIIKVAQGNEEAVDIVGMRLDNAVKLIRGKKGTEVRLTVRKLDGSVKVISIIRDVVIIDETYAKSAIITSEKEERKIGYIKLPSFYADFNNRNGRRCADDVKNEIIKLKKDNVKGVILDLRFNGGGSLQDVVDIAGLFIKSGPVVQVKSRFGAPYVLADDNSALEFDKPLVILVNIFSASASEILAAAMQDYKRAVIIGAPSTFGKGTVQRFFELDDVIPNTYYKYRPLGSLKVTIQKFYRINGESTQLKGVVPDIILPDIYNYLEVGEGDLDYPMAWTQIAPVDYHLWGTEINYAKIKSNSESRVSKNDYFKKVNENAQRLKKLDDEKTASLNLTKYRARQKELREEAKKYENIDLEIPGMKVFSLKEDMNEIKADSGKAGRAQAWFKSIRKDYYISEALNVLNDMK